MGGVGGEHAISTALTRWFVVQEQDAEKNSMFQMCAYIFRAEYFWSWCVGIIVGKQWDIHDSMGLGHLEAGSSHEDHSSGEQETGMQSTSLYYSGHKLVSFYTLLFLVE